MSKRFRPHKDVRNHTKAWARSKREEARTRREKARAALVEALEANFQVPKHLHPTSRGYATHKPWKAGYSFNDPSNLHRHPDYYQGDKRVIKPLKSS